MTPRAALPGVARYTEPRYRFEANGAAAGTLALLLLAQAKRKPRRTVASMDPVLYGPGEGEHHDAGPAQIFIKATGEHTGGSFFLAESTLAPRVRRSPAAPPPRTP
jgi:hypothetical protein